MAEQGVVQITIDDERLKAALHSIRVEFAEWQQREFPLFGYDALRIMGGHGLCSQAEADAAVEEARKTETENPNPPVWDRVAADALGEMHTSWSPQYQRPCVVGYFDLANADKIIDHCRHMGALYSEDAPNDCFVVVMRPDVGPEIYTEDALRQSADQYRNELAKAAGPHVVMEDEADAATAKQSA